MNNTIRIFLLVVGNALALLLALLALETTPTNFLGWVLFAFGIAYGAGGVIYLWRKRNMEDAAQTESGNRSFWWILPGFLFIFFAPPLEWLYLPAVLPRTLWIQIAGLVLILAAIALRIWGRAHIRGLYSGHVEVQADHRLVQSGPYRLVRHPGYTGFLLLALGLSLGYASWTGLISIPLLLIPGLAYRMKVEEVLLGEQVGEQYREYVRKTKRLIPGIW
jgi:protein-S-isoprenylcysteine O-methyltransferase Ste14